MLKKLFMELYFTASGEGLFLPSLLRCKIEPLLKLASASRAIFGLSALQMTFTAPNFRAYVGDALKMDGRGKSRLCSLVMWYFES
jgi:hypothetical protein